MKKRFNKNKNPYQSAVAFTIALAAVFVLCAGLLFFYCGMRHMICAIGIFSEYMPSGLCARSISSIFSGASQDAYQAGIDALRQAGYERTYFPLLIRQFSAGIIFSVFFLLLLLILCSTILLRQTRACADEVQYISHWANTAESISTEEPDVSYIPLSLIDTVYSLKQQLIQQKMIHQEDKAQILHYMENISHQLKTPLAVIRAICENLSMRIPETEEKMTSCLIQADKMASLIRDFLQLGRFDCKKQKLQYGHIRVADLIETVTNDLDAIAQKKQLSFSIKGTKDAVWYCDSFWMEEILGNILKNCVEYSSDGKIQINYKQDANRNQMTITDCGIGLKDGLEKKIFERYASMTRDNKEGSGLGLSIAQQAMKLHFGMITARNRPEGGVEFRLSFPQLDDRAIYQRRTEAVSYE